MKPVSTVVLCAGRVHDTIINDSLEVDKYHKTFTHFDLGYCITTHVSQCITNDFPNSIYDYNYFDNSLLKVILI